MALEDILQQHDIDTTSLILPEYHRAGEESLIYLMRFSVDEVLTQWEALCQLVPETGYWPIVGQDRFKRPPWEEEAVEDILEESVCFNVQEWFEQEWSSIHVDEAREARIHDRVPYPFDFRLHRGSFPFTLTKQVPIALLPTARCWEVPAYLSITLNEWDPSAAVHVAILKYWYERWRAEPVSVVGGGAMEMRVLRPPTTMEEAYALAREQYMYCADLVDQITGSINGLARKLLNSPVWWFWWD